MNRQRRFWYLGALLLAVFVAASVYTFHRCREVIEQGYLASEGNAAENFAVLTAANLNLTNERVEALKNCTYDALLQTEENAALRRMMANPSFAQKVDYAYVMVRLEEDEVRYAVTEENKHRFDAPVGTKLDILWLLDVNVGQSAARQAASADEWSRYSYYIEKDAMIFSQAPTYLFHASEWGDHICGYAPFYTVEGRYVGVIGVELQMSDYYAYCSRAVSALEILMVATLTMLSALFACLYARYRRVQFDKIYIDALTRVYNRSYYNNLFARRMNARRAGEQFALMIADVDWFKKVNDAYGHEIGDEALVELGEILVGVFGRERVVRFGGEEFVAGLWFDDPLELRRELDALFARIEAHRFSARELSLSVSLGCCYHKTEELNGWLLSSMLRAADGKLYEAKENGRKQYLLAPFDPAAERAGSEAKKRREGAETEG